MKRIILLFSALMLSCIALWAHDVEIDGIYYNLDETNKTAEVTYSGDYYYEYSGSVTIPETITYNSEIYSVTSIGNDAFYGCSGLTSITIPNSVTSIGQYAFIDCSGLTKVNYLGTVDKWVEIDFVYSNSNPTDYAKDLYINNELLTDVKITSADSIKDYAFDNCQSIKSVEIGNSVTSIGYSAFEGCSGLTSVTIPNSVTSIGNWAFEDCSGLTKVNYLGTVDKWVEIDFRGYGSNPTSYAKDLYINNELLTDVKITTADSIKNYAFDNCQSIKSVEIGNSVTSIGYHAFSGCSGLTSVTIPNSVRSIGGEAFEGCSSLTSVTIPNSVTSIGNFAFSGCSGLTSVTIGNSVTSIGGRAFEGCSGLSEVTIGNSVTSIGYWAFEDCSGLTKVNYLGTVDKWVEIDFKGYDSNPTSYAKDLYINNELLTDVKITTADSIKNYAFDNCQSIKSVEIGESVTSIGDDAFSDCSGLTSVTIGNSVTSIGNVAFSGCSSLTSVTIPNSVTSIGFHAFEDCSGLTKVNYLGTVDKWVEIDFDYNSNPTSYAKDLYINNELLTDVKITTADSIKGYAFYKCQSIKSVEIGESVTSIGSEAFFGCSGLTKVNYLGTVEKWVEIDFDNYASNPTYYAKDLYINNELLTDVKITTADSIKNYAFDNCQSIKSVEIGESVTSIGKYAFEDCSGLTSVSIGESVTSIGNYAFEYCSGLTEVTIPNSVTSIGYSAFNGCDKLKKVTAYPTTVPNAYENSFAHYNAYLYVPCDVYEDYDLDDVFGNFQYIKCIAAEEDEPTSITETLADANIIVSGGTISADADFSIYNTIGQDVTAFNGSLQPGVYLVSIENNIVKVMVH